LKYPHYKTLWTDQIRRGGTTFEKYNEINKYVLKMFQEARLSSQIVSSDDLRYWANEKASQFGDPSFVQSFQASPSWVARFRKNNNIASRKITKLVNKREVYNQAAILKSAEEFRRECKEIFPDFDANNVLNTDQVGFSYELASSRTLTTRGEKLVYGFANSPKNKITHSYTTQIIINAAGKVVGDIYLCLQEPSGRLSENIQRKLTVAPNITITCSKSGKLNSSLVEYFLDKVLIPAQKDDFLYLIDSWTGQTNLEMYTQRFGIEGTPKCIVKRIPEKTTSLVQPLDTTFNRQWKSFIRKLTSYFTLHNRDVHRDDQIYSRNSVIKMHQLFYHQITSPIFIPMIKYSWKSSGLIYTAEPFWTVKQACFSTRGPCKLMSNNQCCTSPAFIQCARCRIPICFICFYDGDHYATCSSNN
jgi:hypothetical protein